MYQKLFIAVILSAIIYPASLFAIAENDPSLNFGLAAIVLDSDIGNPSALIEEHGEQRIVKLGSQIKPGVFLKKITENRITIQIAHKNYTISVGQNINTFFHPAYKISSSNSLSDAGQIADRWLALKDILAGTLTNPVRRMAEGRLAGAAKINFIPTGVIKSTGLINNDYVTSVNGKKLEDLNKQEIKKMFLNSSQVTLDVVRNGKSITLAFEAF
jgi:type II secretory pathway component PulC